MKNIWIFGKGETLAYSKWSIDRFKVAGEVFVKYWNHFELKDDISKLEGFSRPDLIINTSEPFEELVYFQRQASVLNDAPILHLWN